MEPLWYHFSWLRASSLSVKTGKAGSKLSTGTALGGVTTCEWEWRTVCLLNQWRFLFSTSTYLFCENLVSLCLHVICCCVFCFAVVFSCLLWCFLICCCVCISGLLHSTKEWSPMQLRLVIQCECVVSASRIHVLKAVHYSLDHSGLIFKTMWEQGHLNHKSLLT